MPLASRHCTCCVRSPLMPALRMGPSGSSQRSRAAALAPRRSAPCRPIDCVIESPNQHDARVQGDCRGLDRLVLVHPGARAPSAAAARSSVLEAGRRVGGRSSDASRAAAASRGDSDGLSAGDVDGELPARAVDPVAMTLASAATACGRSGARSCVSPMSSAQVVQLEPPSRVEVDQLQVADADRGEGPYPGPDAPHWCGWFQPRTRGLPSVSSPRNSGTRSSPSTEAS